MGRPALSGQLNQCYFHSRHYGTDRDYNLTWAQKSNSPGPWPDGKKIVFEMFPQVNGQETANIATINADGTGFTQLTFNAPGKGASIDPSWSPDGTKIVFRHCPSTSFCDLFTMNPDGSDVTQITKTAAGEFWPQWAVAS